MTKREETIRYINGREIENAHLRKLIHYLCYCNPENRKIVLSGIRKEHGSYNQPPIEDPINLYDFLAMIASEKI